MTGPLKNMRSLGDMLTINTIGYTGADILSQGLSADGKPSILANDNLDPAKYYRFRLTSNTFQSGNLFLWENGAGLARFEGQKQEGFSYQLYEDNMAV